MSKEAVQGLKVGVALGSGSARGWAHIGVLKALAEMGIHPDVIAGCSIGALVGAAYSNDRLSEFELWVREFSHWGIVSRFDVSLAKGGLLAGDKVFNEAAELIGETRFEALPKPFAAVATELHSGREVWLQQGDLISAVKASCAVPVLFSPKMYQGRWLIDGALVNPVPVSLCRAMGADLVIAVNLNADNNVRAAQQYRTHRAIIEPHIADDSAELKPNKGNGHSGFMGLFENGRNYIQQMLRRSSVDEVRSPSLLGVFSNSLNIMQDRVTRARMAGDPADALIAPLMADYGAMEFHRADEAIEAGRLAVEVATPELMRNILPLLNKPAG
ncbi:patatin-like phospholipase RssA [Corallincola holothuriorum]|uniref:Patatin-like phospholipase RssA n=1 Tax=Corallincola holothuriorum TaxID=2282215 RepID=A0A368NE83_9GAMM|nr:patatin-like phospholipase RssA [Corallincola holothuriorum]RCU48892.1 patatin-like phospholipase RssA [Corallincola holothuriorum]